MRTVATLSTKADTMPAKRLMITIIHFTVDTFPMIISPSLFGISDSMKSVTVPIIPEIIMSTFQSISERALTKV